MRDELHWLPVVYRIRYKLALMVYKCLHGHGPVYLSQECVTVSSVDGRRALRSASHGQLVCPKTRTHIGSRGFYSCAATNTRTV